MVAARTVRVPAVAARSGILEDAVLDQFAVDAAIVGVIDFLGHQAVEHAELIFAPGLSTCTTILPGSAAKAWLVRTRPAPAAASPETVPLEKRLG